MTTTPTTRHRHPTHRRRRDRVRQLGAGQHRRHLHARGPRRDLRARRRDRRGRWTFDTVEGDLWGHPEVNSGGGAWYPPAVDVDAGHRLLRGSPTRRRSPAPPSGPNGTSRPGPNLYTDSLVALDLDTGALRWYHQVTPHDLFDRDQVHTLVATLADGTDVVVSAGQVGCGRRARPRRRAGSWQTEVGVHQQRRPDRARRARPTVTPGHLRRGAHPAGHGRRRRLRRRPSTHPASCHRTRPSYFGGPAGTRWPARSSPSTPPTARSSGSTEVPGDPLGGATVVNDLVLTALLDGTVIALEPRRRQDRVAVQGGRRGSTAGSPRPGTPSTSRSVRPGRRTSSHSDSRPRRRSSGGAGAERLFS